MSFCVVPDIHARKFWLEVKDRVDEFDKIIFLGDYVDPYPYEYELNPTLLYDNPVDCLKEVIEFKKEYPEKVILLLGNHDEHYIWDNTTKSSRYNRFKANEYQDLFYDNLDLFQLAYIYEDIIFTHAGLTKFFVEQTWNKLGYPEDETPDMFEIAEMFRDTSLKDVNNDYIDLFNYISYSRGGWNTSGSLLWADITDHLDRNGEPTKYDFFQIFGHSQLKKAVYTEGWACLDCREIITSDEIRKHSIQ